MGIFKWFGNIIDYIFNPNEYADKGKAGERHIYRELKRHFPAEQIFRNVYLMKEDNRYTEIDMILVTQKGVFVLESKNYSGWVFASEDNERWFQRFKNGTIFPFLSPIIQNDIHIDSLKYNLFKYNSLPYFSIIVFGDRCHLAGKFEENEYIYVVNQSELICTINNIMRHRNDVLVTNDIDYIINILSKFQRPNIHIRKQHISALKKSVGKCHYCNGDVIERINSQTKEIFYGCARYPDCKFTTKSLINL